MGGGMGCGGGMGSGGCGSGVCVSVSVCERVCVVCVWCVCVCGGGFCRAVSSTTWPCMHKTTSAMASPHQSGLLVSRPWRTCARENVPPCGVRAAVCQRLCCAHCSILSQSCRDHIFGHHPARFCGHIPSDTRASRRLSKKAWLGRAACPPCACTQACGLGKRSSTGFAQACARAAGDARRCVHGGWGALASLAAPRRSPGALGQVTGVDGIRRRRAMDLKVPYVCAASFF